MSCAHLLLQQPSATQPVEVGVPEGSPALTWLWGRGPGCETRETVTHRGLWELGQFQVLVVRPGAAAASAAGGCRPAPHGGGHSADGERAGAWGSG